MDKRRILVTSALPYANGHIHLGHLVEYLQTDIWVRFQKIFGHDCRYFCADDTHGTAIMIRAQKEGRTEEALIADMREAHLADFTAFQIEFDNYGSTNSEENREICHRIWKSLRVADMIVEKQVDRFYDSQVGTFLADRMLKGNCPKCKSPDQYGDNCEVCNAAYSATDLIEPKSTLSGTIPELRQSTQLFVEIERLHDFLTEWTQTSGALQTEMANYLKGHFLGDPLRDWDVSRPARYFGFEIPDSPKNYWYVWFDAPIGYIGSTYAWCKQQGEKLEDWWNSTTTEIHHFIGKDIMYFHTLFWPAMLKTAGFVLPKKVHIHGFLKVDGEKMSKSRGTFIMASTYLKHLDPGMLRYYYASKLNSRVEDIDLSLTDFMDKVNSDVVGKVVNIASRSAKFIAGNKLCETYPDDGGYFQRAAEKAQQIADFYEQCEFSQAMREIMLLADQANKYVEEKQPWMIKKDPARAEELREVCTVCLNLFRQLVIYLTPVLPKLKSQVEELLADKITSWQQLQTPLTGNLVQPFQHMAKRIEESQIKAMIDDSIIPEATSAPTSQWSDSGEPLEKEPLAAECTIEDFVKVDLRVARILEAKHVEGAEKLLQLTLGLGGENKRNVFAGIKSAYDPATLVGRLVICCANLKPRKMKFGMSEGMVLAAGEGGKEIFLLTPDEGSRPGQRVH